MLKRGLVIGVAVTALAGSTAAAASAKNLYVSAKGNNANPCTQSAPCSTMKYAIAKAKRGDTVFVEKGTYRQDVIIRKDVRIIGVGNPVDNLKGRNNNGFDFLGRGSSGAEVRGFTIEGAAYEGIVAQNTSHITIADNVVKNNDRGMFAKQPTGECAAAGAAPGDCGEGIHLYWGVTRSTIENNLVENNAGGIYLTDASVDNKSNGPTAHNLIQGNRSINNKYDCGITLAGHSTLAAPGGKPAPTKAGVYANTVRNNVVNGNGVKTTGAGVLMAGGAPGTAVYDNLVEGNTANGNGHAGVTVHSHAPGQDMNGNRILNNKLSHDGGLGDPEFGDFKGQTVGILVGSDVTKLKGIVIQGNTISNSYYGIYVKNDANKVNAKKNSFHKVKVKVKQI